MSVILRNIENSSKRLTDYGLSLIIMSAIWLLFNAPALSQPVAILSFSTAAETEGNGTPGKVRIAEDRWYSFRHSIRIPILVEAGSQKRFDTPVEVNFNKVRQAVQDQKNIGKNPLLLVEVNDRGEVLDNAVPFQFQPNERSGKKGLREEILIFNLRGVTDSGAIRHYHLYLATGAGGSTGVVQAAFTPQITVTDEVDYRGQSSYRITTRDSLGKPDAVYLYQKQGAGLASLFDRDGYDWIDYSLAKGDTGEWRGIPNIGWDKLDEDPGFGHPGYTTGNSEIVEQGPLKTTIRSWSENGKWVTFWEIYTTYARFTVTRVPQGRHYWFLYEGTPGGEFRDTDLFFRNDGTSSPLTERWNGNLRWGYFASKTANRSFYLAHVDHDEQEDSYYKLRTMTVFGFGRGSGKNQLDNKLTETPNRFIIGFAEGTEYSGVSEVIESVINPVEYRVGPPEILEERSSNE